MYRLDGSIEAWLDGVLAALCAVFGETRGTAYAYTIDPATLRFSMDPYVLRDAPRSFFFEAHAAMPLEAARQVFRDSPWGGRLSRVLPAHFASDRFILRDFPRNGVADVLGFQVPLGPTRGAFFNIYHDEVARPDRRTDAHVERLASHARAGLALRERRAQDGLVFRRSQRAEAQELWRRILAGDLAVVGATDAEGDRLLVVRPNAGHETSSHGLTDTELRVLHLGAEGHSNKRISIELGVVESVVSATLRRGMRKLGARHRADLARMMRLAKPATET